MFQSTPKSSGMLTTRECALSSRALNSATQRRLRLDEMRQDDLDVVDVVPVRDHLGEVEDVHQDLRRIVRIGLEERVEAPRRDAHAPKFRIVSGHRGSGRWRDPPKSATIGANDVATGHSCRVRGAGAGRACGRPHAPASAGAGRRPEERAHRHDRHAARRSRRVSMARRTSRPRTSIALAREGAWAPQATVHVPLTRPSHVSLFTGRYPAEHGIRDNVSPPLGGGRARS